MPPTTSVTRCAVAFSSDLASWISAFTMCWASWAMRAISSGVDSLETSPGRASAPPPLVGFTSAPFFGSGSCFGMFIAPSK
jgi:hypothetical protein